MVWGSLNLKTANPGIWTGTGLSDLALGDVLSTSLARHFMPLWHTGPQMFGRASLKIGFLLASLYPPKANQSALRRSELIARLEEAIQSAQASIQRLGRGAIDCSLFLGMFLMLTQD